MGLDTEIMMIDMGAQRTMHKHLQPGERLLWCGRPDPRREATATLAQSLMALPWTILSMLWMWDAAGSVAPSLATRSASDLLHPLLGLPFLVLGLVMMSAPYFAYRRAQQRYYAVTDSRVLMIESSRRQTAEPLVVKTSGL
jgi:hypothetical protein